MNKIHQPTALQSNVITIKNGEWTRPTAKPRMSSRPLPPPQDRKK
jgi:hypothetical protein